MDKKTIIRNFSRYAWLYDKYADVQKLSGLKLLSRINGRNFKRILEIGSGSGNYTLLLREKFPGAALKAVDISQKMVELAGSKLKNRGVEFIAADAENIVFAERFDLITSNACFQWFEDLEKALIKYKGLLAEGGVISFSIFGPRTFWELSESLKGILGNIAISSDGFLAREKIEKILTKNFKKSVVRQTSYRQSFIRLKELLDKIKYSGIRGKGINGRVFFGPELLKKLEESYLAKFAKIKATYEVFFCQGMN